MLIGKKRKLTVSEQLDMFHCLDVNAKLVYELDALKSLAFHAHGMGDLEWEQDLCRKIDELEVKMI